MKGNININTSKVSMCARRCQQRLFSSDVHCGSYYNIASSRIDSLSVCKTGDLARKEKGSVTLATINISKYITA